ncbi:hypothetical protein Golomagni_00107 [Golovinomyces magnicellulatus]|nr:hypothetical protein Golomagni_00107 [Golovinomyces magnicellulatus]
MSKRSIGSNSQQQAGDATDDTIAEDAGNDMQKKLLREDTGHFSLVRMLHLADFITELNGEELVLNFKYKCPADQKTLRLLRCHVDIFLNALLSWFSISIWESMGSIGSHALWFVFRFHGWQSSEMEKKK